jgi:hypothetical protein
MSNDALAKIAKNHFVGIVIGTTYGGLPMD